MQTRPPTPASTPPRAKTMRRQPILTKYCRTYGGKIATCGPSPDVVLERQRHGMRPLQRKVIFDTRENAEAAELEMRVFAGTAPKTAYQCPRSSRGHFHLTTARPESSAAA